MTASAPISTSQGVSSTAVTDENTGDPIYSSIISGTIVANRTEQQVLFFVEGATYLLDPLRSIGLQLPRGTAAVNLFNCDARTPETEWHIMIDDRRVWTWLIIAAVFGGLMYFLAPVLTPFALLGMFLQ